MHRLLGVTLQSSLPIAEGGVAGDVEGHGALVPRLVLVLLLDPRTAPASRWIT